MIRGAGWLRPPFLGQKGPFLACFCQAAHVGLETTPAWAAWSSIGRVRGRSKQARRAPLVGAWALGSEGGSASRKPESGGALGCSFSSVNEGRRRLLAAEFRCSSAIGIRSVVTNAKSAVRIGLRARAPSACELPRRPVVKQRCDRRFVVCAAKAGRSSINELETRAGFVLCTNLSELVIQHLSAAHGRGSCTIRSTKGEPYAERKAVRDRSDPFEALYRKVGLREPIILDLTLMPRRARAGCAQCRTHRHDGVDHACHRVYLDHIRPEHPLSQAR